MKETKKGADRSEVTIMVDLGNFTPNPFQPESRVKVDEETAKAFGLSILEHGLIQTPVCRLKDGHYEIGDGWLRLAGYRWLNKRGPASYKEMPAVVRQLTDQQMADMVMEANTVRKDLNAIELATFFKQYLESFNITQAMLAKKHNCSQGMIANTIRLLELPGAIQQKIISQEISEAHGRQLLRLSKAPEVQAQMAQDIIKRRPSVGELSNNIEHSLWQNSKSINPKSDSYDKPIFDVAECQGCESVIRASYPYGGDKKKEDRCLNTDCWERKNAAATQAHVKAAKEAVKSKGTKEFVTGDEVRYDQRETIVPGEIDTPAECRKCDKTALFKYEADSKGKPERICLDPACYRKKKTKKTRETNKIMKGQDQQLTEDLGKFFQQAPKNPTGCLQVIARHVLPQLSSDGKRDLCKAFDVPTASNGRLDLPALLSDLKEKSNNGLLQLSIAAVMIRERRGFYSSSGYSPELSQDLRRDQAIINGELDKFIAEITAFQEANCRGCETAIEALIGTGEECCNYPYPKQVDAKGKCKGRRKKSEQKSEDE